jgi:beta-alanine degradation protein BauB
MSTRTRGLRALVTLSSLFLAAAACAQDVPRSYLASPDIYKVIAEDARFQVIAVTWKPGQRDVAHGHPAAGVYYLTDCSLRVYRPDGAVLGEGQIKSGEARVQNAIPGHVVENIGAGECRLVMFEPR